MKTYKDYLIDFDKLKVGDEVWSPLYGYGEVTSIKQLKNYPFCVCFNNINKEEWFDINGFNLKEHIMPMLLKEKPDFFKGKKEVKRWRWYYQPQEQSCGYISNNLETETEFLSIFHGENIEPPFKYEKIDCTEITEVVYE